MQGNFNNRTLHKENREEVGRWEAFKTLIFETTISIKEILCYQLHMNSFVNHDAFTSFFDQTSELIFISYEPNLWTLASLLLDMNGLALSGLMQFNLTEDTAI